MTIERIPANQVEVGMVIRVLPNIPGERVVAIRPGRGYAFTLESGIKRYSRPEALVMVEQ